MAINWARGLDELGTGLLRQADIGSRAYEGAMEKEAETRSASRAFAAEERAAKRDYEKEMRVAGRAEDLFGMESERWVDQQKLLHGFRGEEAEATFARLLKADEIRYGRDEASKLAAERRARYDKINDLIMASTSEKAILAIKNNVKRAESADDAAENYGKMLAKAIADGNQGETDRLARELEKAELQRTEAWARIPGVEPLTSRQPTQLKVFSILGNEIADKISLQIGDKLYVKMLLSIKDGKKDSADYQAAVDTIDAALKKIYEANPVLNKYSDTKKRDLRKYLIEKTFYNRSQGITKEDEKRTDKPTDASDKGNGEVEGFSADPAYQAGVGLGKIIGEVIDSFKNLDDMATQIQGSAIGDRISKWVTKEGLSPEQIITRVKERVNNAPERERVVWQIFLDKLAPAPQTAPVPQTGDPDLAMLQPRGMVNPRGGMIFEADQSSMAAPDVNARWSPA